MKKLIHLSDLHICPVGERIVGFDPAARLRAAIASINRDHPDAHACILSGDLTDRGDADSYARLRDLTRHLKPPAYYMLGNHDRRQSFLEVFSDVTIDENGFVQSIVDLGTMRLILLDSLDEREPSAGRLCPRRMAWLERVLGESSGRRVIVFIHHPPVSIGVEYFAHMLLANGGELDALLRRHPAVRHVAFGHVHLPVFGRVGPYSISGARGTCHPIQVTLNGMSATYVDRAPSYEIILVDGDSVLVHHVQLAAESEIVATELADDVGGPGEIKILRQSRGNYDGH